MLMKLREIFQEKTVGELWIFWLFTFFFIFSTPVFSQEKNLEFRHYSTKDGLPHNYINCIYQDSKGFIWLGTRYGVARFDGYEFLSFDPETGIHGNAPSFSSMVIEDENRNIWVFGPETYIFQYKPAENRFYTFPDGYTYAYPDKNGHVWFVLKSGLYRADIKELNIREFDDKTDSGTSLGALELICKERNDKLWVFHELDEINLEESCSGTLFFSDLNGLVLDFSMVNQLFIDSQQFIWISTSNKGLFRFNPEDKSLVNYKYEPLNKNGLCHNYVYNVFEYNSSSLWVGTMDGLCILDRKTGKFTSVIHDQMDPGSLSDNAVTSFYRDNSGTIMVGTRYGLNVLLNKKFRHYYHVEGENSLLNNNVHGFYEDKNENVWIVTSKGMDRFSPQNELFRHYPIDISSESGLNAPTVCITGDKKDNLWLGTWQGGLIYFDRKTKWFRNYINKPAKEGSISNNNVLSLFIDSKETLWVGTWLDGEGGGLDRYMPESDSFDHFHPDEKDSLSLSDGEVSCILEDSYSRLWVGTLDGLNLMTDRTTKEFRIFRYHPSDPGTLSNNKITCMFESGEKELWIGTYGGLNRMDPEDFSITRFYKNDGLPSNSIKAITEDDKGNLWVSTNKGLARIIFDKDDRKNILRINKYTTEAGLQDDEFLERSSLESRNGFMYFGGTNGFNYFNPEDVSGNTIPPPCIITGLKVGNISVEAGDEVSGKVILSKSVSETDSITLTHKHKVFSIAFAGLDYANPEEIDYKYILEGYDDEWQLTGASGRVATYTNLDGGSYIFKVKASINGELWSDKMAVLNITIVPPIWKTWWFRLILVLVIPIGVILFFEIRLVMVKRQRRYLEEQVKLRTFEVEAQKNEILKQKENIENQNYLLKKQSLEIKTQAEHISEMNTLLRKHNIRLSEDLKNISEARVMQKLLDYEEFKKVFKDADACYRFLEELKWGKGFICRKCKNTEYSVDEPFTRRCRKCNYKESVTSGTVFHHLRFPIDKAFYILILTNTGRRININQLSNTLSLRMKTCWSFHRKVKKIKDSIKSSSKIKQGWIGLILLSEK